MSYGNDFYNKSKLYRPLFQTLVDKIGEDEAVELVRQAGEELDRIDCSFPDITKGERFHTHGNIFPRIALYKVLKARFGDSAMEMLEQILKLQGERVGGMYRKLTALPFMKSLFLVIFSSMARKMFGEKNGFSQKQYDTPRGTVKFDILDCPYCRYCRKCDCPELIHTFCDSDIYCYGNIPGMTFSREQTLEHGQKCDFTLKMTK